MSVQIGYDSLQHGERAQSPQPRGCCPVVRKVRNPTTHAHEVLDSTIRVVEAGAHGTDDLVLGEAHLDDRIDRTLEGSAAN